MVMSCYVYEGVFTTVVSNKEGAILDCFLVYSTQMYVHCVCEGAGPLVLAC